jgi:hypothetical protein
LVVGAAEGLEGFADASGTDGVVGGLGLLIQRVEAVFNGVLAAAGQSTGDLAPGVAALKMCLEQHDILLVSPRAPKTRFKYTS